LKTNYPKYRGIPRELSDVWKSDELITDSPDISEDLFEEWTLAKAWGEKRAMGSNQGITRVSSTRKG